MSDCAPVASVATSAAQLAERARRPGPSSFGGQHGGQRTKRGAGFGEVSEQRVSRIVLKPVGKHVRPLSRKKPRSRCHDSMVPVLRIPSLLAAPRRGALLGRAPPCGARERGEAPPLSCSESRPPSPEGRGAGRLGTLRVYAYPTRARAAPAAAGRSPLSRAPQGGARPKRAPRRGVAARVELVKAHAIGDQTHNKPATDKGVPPRVAGASAGAPV
jgi:hypothetical protein